jgi:hypothetical protein
VEAVGAVVVEAADSLSNPNLLEEDLLSRNQLAALTKPAA